jgi:hypothetical protein
MFPHAPQLFGSICRSAHVPEHAASPAGQADTHVAVGSEHSSPAAHATPQPAQFIGPSGVSQPFAGIASQSRKPGRHTALHVPDAHVSSWFAASGQAVQLAPQLAVDVFGLHVEPHR